MTLVTLSAREEPAATALTAAAVDIASTAAALASGLTELNPLGFAGTAVIKVATIAYINQLPEEDRSFCASCKAKRLDSPQDPCERSGKGLRLDAEPALAQAR
jgi:hypothetical protein